MAIQFDSGGSISDQNNNGTISWSHTINNNTNNIIIAAFSIPIASSAINSSPKYAGTNMTKIISGTNSFGIITELYYLLNPPVGLGTINGTWSSGATRKLGISMVYTGVSQATPFLGSVNGTNNGASGSITRTIAGDNRLIGGLSNVFGGTGVIPGTSAIGNERGTIAISPSMELFGNDNIQGTLRWTFPNTPSWAAVGAELNIASTAGTNLIQSAGTSGIGLTSISSSWLSNTTTGNMIVVGVAVTNAITLGTVTSVTDTQGNTYQKAVSAAGTAVKVVDTELWYASNIIGGAGSVTVNLPINAVSIYAREYSGGYNFADVTASAVGSSATPNAGTTAAVAQANELVIVATGDETGGTQTYQAAGAYGDMVGTTTTATGLCMSDNIINTGGAQTGTNTMTVADEWVSVMATFKRLANPRLVPQGMGV